MNIRQAVKDDIAQLVPLMLSYIVDFYQRPNPGERAVVQLVEDLLQRPEKGVQFVVDQDGVLVGFATLYFSFSTLQVKRVAIMNDLFVKQDARGKKVGQSLFTQCLSYVRQHSFAYMQWETDVDNHVAQALYDKVGTKVSDRFFYEAE